MKYFVFNTKCLMRCANENDEEYYKELVGTAKEPYAEEKEEYIKSVAINGEYTVEDDGEPEPEVPTNDDSAVWNELDKAYEEGYGEGYKEGVDNAYDK